MTSLPSNRQTVLTVLSTMACRNALNELIPAFTAATGVELAIEYGATAHLSARIREGARGDVLLAVASAIDACINEATLKTGSRVDLVSSDIAMAVHASAAAPDISTRAALIDTLKAARSIVFSEQGASGLYFASLIQRLGLDEEVRAKATILSEGLTGALVATGDVELAVQQMSELMQVSGINIFGKLPPEVQHSTIFSIGIFEDSSQHAASVAFIHFLQSDNAKRVFTAQGLNPI